MLTYLDSTAIYLNSNKLPLERDLTSVRSSVDVNSSSAKVVFRESTDPNLCICTVTAENVLIPAVKQPLVMELVVLMNLHVLFGHLGFNPNDHSIFSSVVFPRSWAFLTQNQIDSLLETCKGNLGWMLSKLPKVLDGSIQPHEAAQDTDGKPAMMGL
jgi:hypothetical protein